MYQIIINKGTEGNDYKHYRQTASEFVLEVYIELLKKDGIDFEVLKNGVLLPKESYV